MKIQYDEIKSLFPESPKDQLEEIFQTLRESLYQMEAEMHTRPKTKALFERYLSISGKTYDTLEVGAMSCIFAKDQHLEVAILAENFLRDIDVILTPYTDIIGDTPLICLTEDIFTATFGVKNLYTGNTKGFTFTLEGATLDNNYFEKKLPALIDTDTCKKITEIAKSLEKEPN